MEELGLPLTQWLSWWEGRIGMQSSPGEGGEKASQVQLNLPSWGWGPEQHLCNSWLPNFLPSENQPSRDWPPRAYSPWLAAQLDTDLLCWSHVLQTRSGAGSRKRHLLPSTIDHTSSRGSRKHSPKRRVC